MTPRQMKITVALVINGFVVTILFLSSILLGYYGSSIEPYIVGYVIKVPVPDTIWRGDITRRESGRVVEVGCFDFHDLKKLARAHPYKEAFSLQTVSRSRLYGEPVLYSDAIHVSVYPAAADHQTTDDFSEHMPGSVWSRGYCFEMPGTISDSQRIRVTGNLEHERVIAFGYRNPFWRSVTPVPEFDIMPERCYSEATAVREKDTDCLIAVR